MTWLNEILLALFSSLVLLGAATVVGLRLLSVLKQKQSGLILSLAIGLGVIGYIIYGLGLVGLLGQSSIITVFIILIVLSEREIIRLPLRVKQALSKFYTKPNVWLILLSLMIGFFVIAYFIIALAPAIKFDDLWYHLTEAKVYLTFGHIRPFLPPAQLGQSSVTPRLIEMFYTVMLAFNIDSSVGPKLIHFFLGIGSIIGIISFGQLAFNKRTGIIAGLLLASVPVVGWLSQTAYIDLGVVFYGMCALLAYLKWRQGKINSLVFSIIFGFFLATKLWVLLFIPILIIDCLFSKVATKKIIQVFGLSLIVVSPWFIEAWVATGNPVYPVFSGPTDIDHLGGATSLRDWFTRVYWVIWVKTALRVSNNLIPWLPGLALGLLVPKQLAKTGWRWLLIGIGLVLIWSIIPIRDERYLLVFALPLIVVVARLFDIMLAKWLTGLSIVIPSLVLLFFLGIAPIQRAIYYYPVVSGQISKSDFLYEYVAKDIWGCIDDTPSIKSQLTSESKLLVFCHNMFYLQTSNEDGFDILSTNKFKSKEDLLIFLKDKGFTHVFTKAPAYSLNSLFEVSKINESSESVWGQEHFKLVYTSKVDNTSLYAIN